MLPEGKELKGRQPAAEAVKQTEDCEQQVQGLLSLGALRCRGAATATLAAWAGTQQQLIRRAARLRSAQDTEAGFGLARPHGAMQQRGAQAFLSKATLDELLIVPLSSCCSSSLSTCRQSEGQGGRGHMQGLCAGTGAVDVAQRRAIEVAQPYCC